jgi:putative ABC transport system permease protein
VLGEVVLLIAIFKSLGATGGYIVSLHLTHILALSLVGISMGLVMGALTPFIVAYGVGASLPLPFTPVIAPLELVLAAFYGLLVAFVFSIWPLGRAHDVSVAQLFRDQITPDRRLPRRVYVLSALLVWAVLIGLAILTSIQPYLAFLYVTAVGGLFIAFFGLGRFIMFVAARLPRPRAPMLRYALGNLSRPAALTPVMILSAGLGMAVLAVIIMVENNVRASLQQGLPANAPAFFMLDIPRGEGERFESVVKTAAPDANFERVPMMRGRIVRIKDVDAEKIKAADNISWVLDGDRGVTFSSQPPAGSKVIRGAWWPNDYNGVPLVSFDEEIAQGLGLTIGDRLTVNVLGRTIEAQVANLRKIEWRTYGINFVMIFSPNTFAGAPFTELATVAFEGANPIQTEINVMKALAKPFPTVTAIRVREAVQTVNDVVGQIAGAIRGASLLVLLAGVLVLAGALAAVQRQRMYESVVLKTLGATRARVLKGHALEYLALVSIAGFIGLILASVLSYGLVIYIMKVPFAWKMGEAALILTIFGVIIIGLGLAHSWRLLNQKASGLLKAG